MTIVKIPFLFITNLPFIIFEVFKSTMFYYFFLSSFLSSKLGLTKIRAPNSHNRKRLAVESRRHASPDDSHMFIIKLPPNLYYYTGPKAVPHAGESSPKNSLDHNANGKKVNDIPLSIYIYVCMYTICRRKIKKMQKKT